MQCATFDIKYILFCIRKMLDKCHSRSTDFTRQKTNSESVQIKKFLFFINPILTFIQTALKALKKSVQMYEIIYNFCTLLITENSMKLGEIHRECIVK